MNTPPTPPIPGTRVSDYDYDLPPDRVARYPAERRDQSRLLVVPRGHGPIRHEVFSDLPNHFSPGDLLVLNESRVLPVRLLGRKPTGAPAEVFLLRPISGPDPSGPKGSTSDEDEVDGVWEALVRPGGKLKPGRVVEIAEGFSIEVLDSTAEGSRIVRLDTDLSAREALERFGTMPLPPYIQRDAESLDRDRYQTVYAKDPGSVAAPTAGLHFTDGLLDAVAIRGVGIAKITLHVGIGTFRPMDVDDPADHVMHSERFQISTQAAEAFNRCRSTGGKIWAVGTTVVRTLESCMEPDGRIRPGQGSTRLFIRPPYEFKAIDGLITNFHLPRSTLLMLVSAFAGYDRTREAYEIAISEGYRFYSYGDAMVIE